MPKATVVICTHNRARILGRAVGAALEQAEATDAEVLIVDNASTDDTPAVLADLMRRAGPALRTVREPELGLSAARNRGLAEARGAVAIFLDDDAVPRPGWAAAVLEAFRGESVACAGGPIRLHFPTPPPPWLTPEFHAALTAYDLGPEPRQLEHVRSWEYPCGANVAFRVAVARDLGGFSVRFGPRGDHQLQHDETDLCLRIDRAGGVILYRPDAVVDHWVLDERLTPAFFLDRHWQRGRSGALCELRNRGLRPTLHLLRWYHGPNLLAAPHLPGATVDPARLLAACRRREAMGYVVGIAQGLVGTRRPQERSGDAGRAEVAREAGT
jgi:glycosyltransferase involved in cell wall biosynthesis